MKKTTVSSGKVHKIRVKKPFPLLTKEKIYCPFCGNEEEFYEIIENATFYIHYVQTAEGTLEPIEQEAEVMGPVKFFCGVCNSDLTLLKK